MRKIEIFFIVLALAPIQRVVAQAHVDSVCYVHALDFIRYAGEVREAVNQHLGLAPIPSKLPLPFAVSDTLSPISFMGHYFDTSSCAPITDRSTILRIYDSELAHLKVVSNEGKEWQYYSPFAGLWNDTDSLVVECGQIFRHSMCATISLREPEQLRVQVDTSQFHGIISRWHPRGRPRDIEWNFLEVYFCFKNNGEISRFGVVRCCH